MRRKIRTRNETYIKRRKIMLVLTAILLILALADIAVFLTK